MRDKAVPTGTNGASERETYLVIPRKIGYPILDKAIAKKLSISFNLKKEQCHGS
jgi:hypothetical protein